VLFGGFAGSTNYLADTWAYDGTTWSLQSPATSPPARSGASMAYDAATGQMVLIGGLTNGGYLADTWTYQPVPVTVPGAPTNVSATAGNAQVQLSWTAPSSDGGSAITGYDVYQGTTSGGEGATPINSVPITGTTYMATGLSNGTTYYFTVKAINVIGHSPASNETSATPVTVPDAPIGLTATAHPGNIALAWTAPTNTGGSAIENYQVFRGTTSGGESTTPLATVTATSYTDTSSTPGVTYYYTVKAYNAQGNSVASVEAHALISTTLAGGPHLAATPDGTGYWVVGPTGAVTAYGTAHDHGSEVGKPLNGPIVGIAATPDGQGYWLVGTDGGVFTFGDAGFYGSEGGKPLNQPVVGIATTADGQGYWLVATDGGVFTFGDATFYGSMGSKPLNQPIVDIAPAPDGHGYWLVATDGGVFAFGDATFYGSMGGKPLNQPVVGIAASPTGKGYWLVASDGGIFTFGDAGFYGSLGGTTQSSPLIGLIVNPQGTGYELVNAAGRATSFPSH
jgi:hypothetical protein